MAAESGDSAYVSKLDEASRKKAKDELHEINDRDREIAVHTLRKWVIEQEWLKSPTDFSFLLRFLRARKFSQLGARQTIENYWTCRTRVPEWFKDVDPADKTIQEILKTGFLYSPLKYDKEGRRVLISKLGCIDLERSKQWGMDNIFKTIFLVYDWMAFDENVQVNGIYIFCDHSDLTYMFMMHFWTPTTAPKFIRYFLKSLPARIKGIHNYNEPTFFDAVLAIAKPLMSQKMRSRLVLHGRSLVKIYGDVGKEVLPKEYLPDDYTGSCAGTIADIVDEMIEDMKSQGFRDYIKDLSSDRYGVDMSKQKLDTTSEDASFRKISLE